MSDFAVVHERPECFYDNFDRKAEDQKSTHYCPGCGHGITHKLLAEAIDELGIRDRTIIISPVGCSVFIYYYFDVGNIQVAHGRAAAVATAVKRARPDAIVISYQGDGDLAAIGCAEIVHAANRGECTTTIFVNNAIYGMTGGQMAPTTLIGQKSTTTPFGRSAVNDGYPLKVSEMLAALDAPVYLERVALGNPKQILQVKKAIFKAVENQVKGLGFSLVEVLSPCPTIFKLDPVEAQRHVREVLIPAFPLGVKKDRTKEVEPRAAHAELAPLSEIPRILRIAQPAEVKVHQRERESVDWRLKIAGFGGQGVLLLGQMLAEAGMDDGLEVSWLPSYGPEMRSGTSNCNVRLADKPIDSPVVSRPNALLALNEPSLRKFIALVQPGGLVLYNSDHIPEDCRRDDVRWLVKPFAEIADGLGSAKAGNVVMLGAFLALTNALPDEAVNSAMKRLVKTERWLELDRKALERGRQVAAIEEVPCHA
jgi:2-oxoisovalerate ferredoxin oxidoreductase beta subunit